MQPCYADALLASTLYPAKNIILGQCFSNQACCSEPIAIPTRGPHAGSQKLAALLQRNTLCLQQRPTAASSAQPALSS